MSLILSILVIAISSHQIMAQNVTTNASNAVGNMTAVANQTASELGQNTSLGTEQCWRQSRFCTG